MKNSSDLKTVLLFILLIVFFAMIGIYILFDKVSNVEKSNKKILEYNSRILEKEEIGKELLASELLTLIYNVDNINKKYKQEDLEDKYINTNIEVEVKNEKYIAGREGSRKYIELSLEQIMKKDLSEFTYLFSDVTFEIIKIDKNKQGRIVNIIVREKEKKKE
jgi:hypothetical protein